MSLAVIGRGVAAKSKSLAAQASSFFVPVRDALLSMNLTSDDSTVPLIWLPSDSRLADNQISHQLFVESGLCSREMIKCSTDSGSGFSSLRSAVSRSNLIRRLRLTSRRLVSANWSVLTEGGLLWIGSNVSRAIKLCPVVSECASSEAKKGKKWLSCCFRLY